MDPESSLSCSHDLATGSYPEPVESSPGHDVLQQNSEGINNLVREPEKKTARKTSK